MWGFIYVVVFLAAFLASAVMKMTADPFHGKYTVKWDESVGTVYADLSYGEGAANKFDLYVPADSSRDSYGLAVYLHAGGFTTGDKQDDRAMLQWLCSKGYVAAGINYALRDEAHPEASVYSQSVEINVIQVREDGIVCWDHCCEVRFVGNPPALVEPLDHQLQGVDVRRVEVLIDPEDVPQVGDVLGQEGPVKGRGLLRVIRIAPVVPPSGLQQVDAVLAAEKVQEAAAQVSAQLLHLMLRVQGNDRFSR